MPTICGDFFTERLALTSRSAMLREGDCVAVVGLTELANVSVDDLSAETQRSGLREAAADVVVRSGPLPTCCNC